MSWVISWVIRVIGIISVTFDVGDDRIDHFLSHFVVGAIQQIMRAFDQPILIKRAAMIAEGLCLESVGSVAQDRLISITAYKESRSVNVPDWVGSRMPGVKEAVFKRVLRGWLKKLFRGGEPLVRSTAKKLSET